MAEDKPVSKKRRVRNPETFRERAIKASEAADKPTRQRPVRQALGKHSSKLSATWSKLFRVQPFKTLAWIAKKIGYILVPSYFRNSASELRKVVWPNWKQSRQLTFAVLAFAVVFGAVVASVDYGLDKVFKLILLK